MVELGLTSETLQLFEKAPILLVEPSFFYDYAGGFQYCIELKQSSITKVRYCSVLKVPQNSTERGPYTRDCQSKDVGFVYNLFKGCKELKYQVSLNLEGLCLWIGGLDLVHLNKKTNWVIFKNGLRVSYFEI